MIFLSGVSIGIVIGWIVRSQLIKQTKPTGRWISAKTECPICGHKAIHVYPEGIEIECGNCGSYHEPIVLKTYDDNI